MEERRDAGWRAWLAGALFVALLVGALVLNRRTDAPAIESPVVPTPSPSPTAAPVLAKPEPPLDRAALITAASATASAFSVGAQPPPDQSALVGKRFALHLAIGCTGPVSADLNNATGWRYDTQKESLRISAAPEDWREAQWVRALFGGGEIDAADGFWIERPWIFDAKCPAGPAPASASAPERSSQAGVAEGSVDARQLGLVQLLPAGAPRSSSRSGRAYTAVVKRAPDAIGRETSFMLVLNGRIAAFPDGRPIACQGSGWAGPPRCLIAARIERVAIVDRAGEQLAEWQQ